MHTVGEPKKQGPHFLGESGEFFVNFKKKMLAGKKHMLKIIDFLARFANGTRKISFPPLS